MDINKEIGTGFCVIFKLIGTLLCIIRGGLKWSIKGVSAQGLYHKIAVPFVLGTGCRKFDFSVFSQGWLSEYQQERIDSTGAPLSGKGW